MLDWWPGLDSEIISFVTDTSPGLCSFPIPYLPATQGYLPGCRENSTCIKKGVWRPQLFFWCCTWEHYKLVAWLLTKHPGSGARLRHWELPTEWRRPVSRSPCKFYLVCPLPLGRAEYKPLNTFSHLPSYFLFRSKKGGLGYRKYFHLFLRKANFQVSQ